MRKLSVIFLLIVGVCSVAIRTQEAQSITKLDPALDAIVPSNAKVEKLAGDFHPPEGGPRPPDLGPGVGGTAEGPVWVRNGGYLLFSDIPDKVMDKWDPKDGKVTNYPKPGAELGSNGITLDRQGRVVFCALVEFKVIRLEKDGKRTVLASEFEGKRLNRPNDLVYKSDGSLYFTDPVDYKPEMAKESYAEIASHSHFFLLKKGNLILLDTHLVPRPNGLALTPDEKHLYLVSSRPERSILIYDILPDDTIANGKMFIDMKSEPNPGGPDGMKVDEKGNVYCPGPGGLWIISAEGKHLGTVALPEGFANLAFGEADGKTLFMTGRTSLYRIRLNIPGIRP